MEYYFITGSSSGLGKAFAEEVLEKNNVTGIARHQTIYHNNYKHLQIDLSKRGCLDDFSFDLPDEAERVVLINNAGSVEPVNHIGEIENLSIEETIHLNTTVVMMMCNKFIAGARAKSYPCLIINISSGAAVSVVPSWSVYCSSKAAIDMFTRVADADIKELGLNHIGIFSVYPGIVDTPMQAKIRSKDESDFSSKIRFVEYHETGQLVSPDLTARKILSIFSGLKWPDEVVFSIRDK